MKTLLCRLALLACALLGLEARGAQEARAVRVLLLGDTGHHKPADFFKAVEPTLAKGNIEVVYTDKMQDLNATKLAGYD
jgi:uncharacterized protein